MGERTKNEYVPGALKQPWRNFEKDFEWNKEYLEKLLGDITKHDIKAEDIQSIRILLVGQIKAGKSSFLNTVASIDKERVTQITRSGRAESSLTLQLKEYTPQNRLKNICILDTMGLEEDTRGLNVKDLLQVVDGHVSNNYMIKWIFGRRKKDLNVTKEEEPVPWRKFENDFEWNEEYLEKLIGDITKHDIKEEDIKSIRILLLGQIKAGKSSFVNTLASIDKGRVTQITRSGEADSSLTTQLKEYTPENRLKNICILDIMGLEEDTGGLNVKDILQEVDGHVPNNYKFNTVTHIQDDDPSYKAKPQRGDRVHCIVFAVDANILGQDNVSDATRRKIKSVGEELKSRNTATFVLITKIDVLCELVERDITKTFHSEKVKKAVDVAAELYNIPRQNIFFVKNYEREIVRDINIEILVLLALRQMMYVGTDFLNEASASG